MGELSGGSDYAVYVWSAYGIAVLLIGGLVLVTLRRSIGSRRAMDGLEHKRRRRKRI
jgi:heme exporter protein CcmD